VRTRRFLKFAERYGRAVAVAARAFTFGVVSRRGRNLIARLAREDGYRDGPVPQLPPVAIDEITSPSTIVVLPEPEAADGNVSLLELLVLARLARERGPRQVFEIGTFNGRTTLALAANTPEDALVYTLDLPPAEGTRYELAAGERLFVDKPASGALFATSPLRSRIRQLFGDSATFDVSGYRADFIFIDGSHAFDYVLSDSVKALGMLSAGGIVVWHDYGAEWEGVTRALHQLQTTDPRFATLRHVAGTTLAVLFA
jgi:predicted O-methyltransferase YrrM